MKPHFFYKVFMGLNTAILVAGPVIICLFIGIWLDGLLLTSPIFSFTGGMLGFVGSIVSLMRLLKSMK